MADDEIEITPGTGKKVDTRTVDTDQHRQVVVIGDPASTDVASVDGASGGVHVKLVASSLAAPALTVNLVDAGGDAITTLPVSGPLTDTQLRATAVPVSGTVTANVGTGTQAVSGTVAVTGVATETTLAAASAKLPAALAAGGGLKVEGVAGGVAQPISGTVTANAGTNLNTSLLALETGGNLASVQAATSALFDTVATLGTTTYTEATTKGTTIGAVRRDADTTLVNTTNEIGPLQMDANGRLKVEAFSGETLPVSGTFWQATQPVSGTVTANAGTGTLAVSIASLPALTTGSAAIGKLAANSGVDIGDVDVTSLPAIPAGANAIGSVSMDASAANGCDVFRSIDLDESEEEAKATAATLYGWYFVNRATTVRYVKLYNATAANVTVGTTAPVMTLPIPGSTSNYVGANMAFAPGIKFGTALTAAATTGIADNDTGAPAANDVVVNLFFK